MVFDQSLNSKKPGVTYRSQANPTFGLHTLISFFSRSQKSGKLLLTVSGRQNNCFGNSEWGQQVFHIAIRFLCRVKCCVFELFHTTFLIKKKNFFLKFSWVVLTDVTEHLFCFQVQDRSLVWMQENIKTDNTARARQTRIHILTVPIRVCMALDSTYSFCVLLSSSIKWGRQTCTQSFGYGKCSINTSFDILLRESGSS